MFLLIDDQRTIQYIATIDRNGNPSAIHTRTDVDSSEESVKKFFDLMPSLDEYHLVDVNNDPISVQEKILEDFKESLSDISIDDYDLESEVIF